MNHWILTQTSTVGKQILDNPFISLIGAISLWIFQHGFGANKTVLVAFLLYLLLICLDWLTGTTAAKKDGIDTSEYGIEGGKRTVFLVLLIVIARLIDFIMHTKVIVTGVVIATLARSIARSVIANTKRCGWDKWMADWLVDWVQDEIDRKEARAKQRLEEVLSKRSE